MTRRSRVYSGFVSSATPSCELSWDNDNNPLNCQCCFCAWCRWALGLVGIHKCPCNLFRLRDTRNAVAKWLEHPWCSPLLCRAKAHLEIECSGSGLRVHIRSHSSLDSASKKIIPAAAARQAAKRRERNPYCVFLILEIFSCPDKAAWRMECCPGRFL
jgi:hypothetical protein